MTAPDTVPTDSPASGGAPNHAEPDAALAAAEELVAQGRTLDAVELLHHANAGLGHPDVERRLAQLRRLAYPEVSAASAHPVWPVPVPDPATDEPPQVPELAPAELSGAAVRRAIDAHGAVLVPGLFGPALVEQFISGIQKAIQVRATNADGAGGEPSSWYAALPLPDAERTSLGRQWVAAAGGVLAADSPKLLDLLLSTYEQLGLKQVLSDYLGERPILSANKCTLREVPLTGNTDWHQDGAFLGSRAGLRALNVWVALTDCGTEAPGMDLVPLRFESIQETGTGGAIFDWAVGPDVVSELSSEAPVVRPEFKAGDALLFDDLYLHRSAVDAAMVRPRYAIESWFFARTNYPEGQVPLVW